MAHYNQEDRLFKVFTPLEDDVLLLDRFSGAEAMSAPFRFSLRLFSEKDNLQLKDLMGQSVTVHLGTFDGDPHFFHGHVVSFTHAGSDGGLTYYDMQLGPWLDFLRRRLNCRIFQEMKAEDILRKVFADYGALAKHDIRVASKDVVTMCVQYNETDFQFVSRLLESLGWFYFFTHDDGVHTMVIDKDSPSLSPLPQQPDIEFNDSPGSESEDAVDQFESFRILVPNKLALKTFDFKNPTDPLLATADTQHQMGDLPDMEWYEHHGPYAYKEFEEGDDLAKLRLEEAEARSKGFRGAGNCRAMTSGHTFKLSEHYLYDGEYLVLSVEHKGSNNYFERNTQTPYRNSFTAIRKSVAFRPPSVTPRPIMRGPQSATVVGKDGEEIDCDEYGRIRIQFHWDREGKFNEQSSCWARLAMPWAGDNFGFISIPRMGQEVLVDFLEGDPDLPVIVGSLYNEHHKPPWDLPENKTQTGILTRSAKKGTKKNANALRFEDKRHHEEVWLHAERNQLNDIEVDETHSVGNDRGTTIGNDDTLTIHGNLSEFVDKNHINYVDGRRDTHVKEHERLIVSQGDREVLVELGGDSHTVSTGNQVVNITAGNYTLTAGGHYYANTTSEYHVHAPEVWAITDNKVHLKAGASELFVFPDHISLLATSFIELKVGGSTIKVDAAGIHLSGPAIDITATGTATVSGSIVKLNC